MEWRSLGATPASGKEFWTEPLVEGRVTELGLSPDGTTLVLAEFGGNDFQVRDAASGKLRETVRGHTAWITEFAFTQDGSRLMSAGTDQTIRVWGTKDWKELKLLRGHLDEVEAISLARNQKLMASVGKQGQLMISDLEEDAAVETYRLYSPNFPVGMIDDKRLMLEEGILDLQTGLVAKVEPGPDDSFISAPGVGIIARRQGEDGIAFHKWNDDKWSLLGSIAAGQGQRPENFDFDATGQQVAWARGDTATSIFLEKLNAPGVRVEIRSDLAGISELKFSEDGRFLCAVEQRRSGGRSALIVWELANQRVVAAIASGDGRLAYQSVRMPTFAAGGASLAVITKKRIGFDTVFLDLTRPGGRPLVHSSPSVTFFMGAWPDGDRVIVSEISGLVRIFDAFGKRELARFRGHLNGAFGADISKDGKRLLTASGRNEAIKLWDLSTQQELLTLEGEGAASPFARWMEQGNVIFASKPSQSWRAPSWEEIRAAEAGEARLDTGTP